ncbi:MAG: hypothetical protein ABJB11_24490 [Ferruginibacter sp.]
MKHLFLVFVIFCSCQTREVKLNAPVPASSADSLATQAPPLIEIDKIIDTTNTSDVNINAAESAKKENTPESIVQKNTAELAHKKMIDSLCRNNPKGGATDGDGFIPFIKQF